MGHSLLLRTLQYFNAFLVTNAQFVQISLALAEPRLINQRRREVARTEEDADARVPLQDPGGFPRRHE